MIARTAGALLTLTAATTVAGCGSSGSDEPAAAANVAISGFKFAPDRVTVKVGAKVSFANADRAPHTATMKPAFDTGVLRQDQSKVVTLTKAGAYAYICDLHPYMKATLVAR